MHHRPGDRVLDRYTIVRGIAVGGFGEVYFATSDGGKEVALKRIQQSWDVELRGARQCLNVKHPHLVSLHDVVRDDAGRWWIVMEYVGGKTLRQVLKESPGGLVDDELKRFFVGACRGVAHLHRRGLVHRDVKPANLFDDDGVVKVGDYGLTKFISASADGGHTGSVGTFHYMAPEVGRGEYGPGVDVYALGVLLFEMACGRVPIDGQTTHEIVMRHLTETVDVSGIDRRLAPIVSRCLEKDPGRRYRDANDLLVHFQSAMSDGVGVTSPGITPVAPQAAVTPVFAPERPADPADTSTPPTAALVWTVFAAVAAAMAIGGQGRWIGPVAIGTTALTIYLEQRRSRLKNLTAAPEGFTGDATPPAKPRRFWTRADRRRHADAIRVSLDREPTRRRMGRTLTAIPAAAVAAALASFGLHGIGLTAADVSDGSGWGTWSPAVWTAGVSSLIAASVLSVASMGGESGRRRLRRWSPALGFGVGIAAAGLSDYLLVDPGGVPGRDVDWTAVPDILYGRGGVSPLAYGIATAVWMTLVDWRRLTDPLRRKRLRLTALIWPVGAAWLTHQFLPTPQPAGLLVAAVAAAAVQAGATWLPPDRWEAGRPDAPLQRMV